MITHLDKPYPDKETLGVLTPVVRKWFISKFKRPSPPQQYSIANIKYQKNTLISSPTGSGKTLSAFLTILDELLDRAMQDRLEDRVHCIYISPLKALGNDISTNLMGPLEELTKLAPEAASIRVATRTGDTTRKEKADMLKNPPHILITTPESLTILLSSPKFSAHLKKTEWVIVDEIHALADNKRGVQLSSALERLGDNASFARIGLSATVAPLDEVAKFLVGFEDGNPRQCDIVDVNFTKQLDIKVLCPVDNLIQSSAANMRKKQYELIHQLIQEHSSTLVFTNTRAATERVVHELSSRYPSSYHEEESGTGSLIKAHHGSLSKEKRLLVEESLRAGSTRCVVCSTSLELGIDIGHIDLVILLGSPKSVARALQRIGRAGHQLTSTAKGRIIVLDRDDLVECTVLAREALEGRVDRISIPTNALDVLAQEIYALAIDSRQDLRGAYKLLTQSYAFHTTSFSDFMSVIRYLAGEHASLEDRHVYAKIWYDEQESVFGRRGRMARVIYMTNTGTIPDQTGVQVKVGIEIIGSISEPFLEQLTKGDVFVLGGEAYEFRYSRGMTAQVRPADGKRPTVPSWFSEMLPLSFDLAMQIQEFRLFCADHYSHKSSVDDVTKLIIDRYPVTQATAKSIASYMYQQHIFAQIPNRRTILVEYFRDGHKKHVIVHSLYGRRVNEVLSRAVGLIAGKLGSGNTEISVSDNGFVLRYRSALQAKRALELLAEQPLDDIMEQALNKSEVLRRRFRHCAGRALMILRNYKGRQKSVGRQQVSSQLLMSAVKRLDEDFPILREARREVLEDFMDVSSAKLILDQIKQKRISIVETTSRVPSPFSFSLVLLGVADVMKIEERQAFLRRMHQEVLAAISLDATRAEVEDIDFSYDDVWQQQDQQEEVVVQDEKTMLKTQLYAAARKEKIPADFVLYTQQLIDDQKPNVSFAYIEWVKDLLSGTISKSYDDTLVKFLQDALPSLGWK